MHFYKILKIVFSLFLIVTVVTGFVNIDTVQAAESPGGDPLCGNRSCGGEYYTFNPSNGCCEWQGNKYRIPCMPIIC